MKPVYKYNFDLKQIELLEQRLRKKKLNFHVIMSNYTTRYILEDCDILFFQNDMSMKAFAAFSKVKKDVQKMPKPRIKEDNLIYYQSNISPMYADKVFCTDISSAYANVLYNDGYISSKTFDYLSSIDKKDRLSSVGMLASHKTKFIYENGKLIADIEIFSELQEYFFYAVKKTFQIMQECKFAAGKYFLLIWVDCIYYMDETVQAQIEQTLTNNHLSFKSFPIYEFEAIDKGDDCLVKYKKNGKPIYFYVPK